MAPNPIKLRTLAAALLVVVLTELPAARLAELAGVSPLALLGLIRCTQIAGMLGVVFWFEKGLGTIGWAVADWAHGVKKGILWSLGFGAVVAAGMLTAYLLGHNPLMMIRAPLPEARTDLIFFFLVGGLIGPAAEEIFFRGLLYTFFRRWGILAALGISTALFVVLHSVHGLPFIQIAGGLVFALAYETSRNLMVPMVIHVSGNSVLFLLSLPAS